MRKAIVLSLLLLPGLMTFGQSKPKSKEKPPTQKEMADMMKEMQAEMANMSAEDKKMLDSMGIKMPSASDIPNMTDKQIATAWEDEGRIIPKKDAARIAAIPKAVPYAKMGAYIAAVHDKLVPVFATTIVSTGNELYAYIKTNTKSSAEAGTVAAGFWLAGQPELALYLLGKVCAADATNTDNLSNYAAMLSMQGAQHLAIPIIDNLNRQFPKNSTLLNNLGQAWFGLGETVKAEKYLDSAIRICAYHPQANLTKSLIEESKGKKTQAIEAVKRSITKSYSQEKENRLKKLGYKLQPKDLRWNQPMPQDPLGLEQFKWPDYPMNVQESSALEKEWAAFKKTCDDRLDQLKAQEKALQKEVEQGAQVRVKQLMQAGQQGRMVNPMPTFASKAVVKLGYIVNDKDGHMSYAYQKKVEAVANAHLAGADANEKLSAQLKALEEKYEDQFGEGRPNPFEAACGDDTKAKDAYLRSANLPMREAANDFLQFMRRKFNQELYYYQYTMWPETFELVKLQTKMTWLTLIKDQYPKFQNKSPWCRDKAEGKETTFKLREFDDFACRYKSKINLVCLKMETNCGQTTTTYGCGQLQFTERELGEKYTGGTLKLAHKQGVSAKEGPLSISATMGGDFTIELDENNEVKDFHGKMGIKVEGSVGIMEGPVQAGVSGYEAVEIEMGNNGIEDVVLVIGAKATAGIKAPTTVDGEKVDPNVEKGIGYVNKALGYGQTSISVGAEHRISMMSGHGNLSGTGLASGVRLAGW